jgi:hypothetical protein
MQLPSLSIGGPAELAAVTPYVLGYQPEDGHVVVHGMRANRDTFSRQIGFTTCFHPRMLQENGGASLGPVAAAMNSSGIFDAIVFTYGPDTAAAQAAALTQQHLEMFDIDVSAAFRIHGGQCYCITRGCEGTPQCPDASGTPIDGASLAVTQAVHAGLTAQPSRKALEDLYAPLTGTQQSAAQAALRLADHRLHHHVLAAAEAGTPAAQIAAMLNQQGIAAVDDALARARTGQHLSDADIAWLLQLIRLDLRVRDYFWSCLTGERAEHELLRTLLRAASAECAAGPACLLAIWALMAGEGAIASIALQQAEAADPSYTMTGVLHLIMSAGISATQLRDMLSSILRDYQLHAQAYKR